MKKLLPVSLLGIAVALSPLSLTAVVDDLRIASPAVAEAPFPECPPEGCKAVHAEKSLLAEAPFPECPPEGCKA